MRYIYYLLLAAIFASLQGCPAIVATGVGTGALMASDRRTTGAFIEDESIETKALLEINAKFKSGVHVNVTSYNRHVLITGEVPNEETRTEIRKIVTSVQNVKAVSNELGVAGTAAITSRSSDSLITADVKLRFLNNKVFQPDHVKVITEWHGVPDGPAEAAFSLKNDEVSKPVLTSKGYDIIKVLEKKDAETKSLEESGSRISNKLEQTKRSESIEKLLKDVKGKTEVVIYQDAFKKILDASKPAVDKTDK